ncbi:MAG: Ig-like domain-containing protein [Ilumatobacteraceae bacterium]
MGQIQKVSWRTVGYAALGAVVAAASVVAIINSDGVRPTSLTSSAASRWLVDQVNKRVVLVDGLTGQVVAKIATESERTDDVAVQGAGGAFLVGTTTGSIRSISSSKLQLGAAQAVGVLLDPDAKFGVGTSGLTVVSAASSKASIVAVDDVTRPITVPKANDAYVAADGSMWLLSQTQATHVNIDESTATNPLRSISSSEVATVGSRAVSYDSANRTVRWLDGGDVPIDSLTNASQAVLQQPSDDAPCVWLGAGDTLVCVGKTRIEQTVLIKGLNIQQNDKLAISGAAAVVVSDTNDVQRIDLESRQLDTGPRITVRSGAQLSITASGNLVWLDDTTGEDAWIVHRFGVNHILKDAPAPEYDAQGQAQPDGSAGVGPIAGGGDASGNDEAPKLDNNGHQDPPVAVPDSVTARAGSTITIPVTVNDYDPDDDPIAVVGVGNPISATHGTTDVLDGTSVAYRPNPGYSGTDSFSYTITDPFGNEATGLVSVELFDPNSPNRPPIARPDKISTHVDRAVTIDVLANDIDPERDMLTISTFSTFQSSSDAKIIDVSGPTKVPVLIYTPPPGKAGIYEFTYQAADPQGGISQKTKVTVDVSTADSRNEPPVAVHDAISLPVGITVPLDVKANDSDPDGDPLTIKGPLSSEPGVTVVIRSQVLDITLAPGAPKLSVVQYTLSDGDPTHDRTGKVLVLRQSDTAPNRAPVANADTERVVIGNSVKIPVTLNDVDPDNDPIRLLLVDQPADGAGTTVVDGNSVRFTPTLPDITESTPVTFSYTISDAHGHEATGKVTVNVLVEPLPRAPFARDDFADTVTDKPVIINVLANDTDPSGGSPHLQGKPSCPNGGDATITADERVNFLPPTGQFGVVVRCTYRVSNNQGLPAEASIIVTVAAPPQGNHEPTLNDSAKNQTVMVGDTLTLHANAIASDADSDPLLFTAGSVVSPIHGRVDFTGKSETLVYTPPAVGSTDKVPVVDTLDVTISDGHDGNDHDLITVLVVNKPPTVAAPQTRPILRSASVGDPPLPIDVVAELRDLNSTASLTLASVKPVSGPGTAELVNGMASIKITGPGLILATYTVIDSGGTPSSNEIRVTVADAVPANPPVAVDDSMIIASGGTNSVDLFANDTGITDPGDKPVASLQNRPPGNFGTVQLVGGTLTFIAAPNASGLVPLNYTLSDGSGQSSSATVTLNLLPCSVSPPTVRDATIFTPYQTPININLNDYVLSGTIQPASVVGGQLTGPIGVYTPPDGMNDFEVVTYTVENGCHQTVRGQLTIDVNRPPVGGTITRDLARGDNLTLFVADLASDDEKLKITSIDGNPSWVSMVLPSGQPGTLDETTISAAPPSNAASGTYHFTVHVEDPGKLTAVAGVTFNIRNVAPVAIADQYTTTVTDSLYAIPDPTLNDTDTEPGVLTIQTASVIDGPATIQSITGNVIVVLIGHGVSTLNYTIVDQGGLTASSTITITSNRAPSVGDVSGHTNGQPTLDIPFRPGDPDGDPMSATCNNNPSDFTVVVDTNPNHGSGATIDPVNPVWSLDITVNNSNFADPTVFQCTVIDRFGATAVSNVTLTQSD